MNRPKIEPADQAARTYAVKERRSNIWVEAGAGTGKTTLLISRLLSLLDDGVKPLRLNRLAAITFTEKAAGELKVNIRQSLEKELAGATEDGRRDRLARALADLETAAISTLHSFARLLLSERPVEADIDPRADLLDEEAYRRWLAERYDAWFDGLVQARAPAVLRWYLQQREYYQRRSDWDWLWKLVQSLDADADVLLDAVLPEPFDLAAALAAVCAQAEEALAHAEEACPDHEDKAFVQTAALAQAATALPPAAERETCLTALPAFAKLVRLNVGSKKKWASGEFEENKERRRALREAVAAIMRLGHDGQVRELFDLARSFVRGLEDEKRRAGILNFQGLLVRAVEMLQRDKTARAWFQQRFDALLIDEFQDTDPLQVAIAFFLCEDGARADRVEDVRLKPGKLLIVGDPKQSIYRFRRADIEVYEHTKRAVLGERKPTHITVNFRSAPEILGTVNRLFAPLMQPDPELPTGPAYVPLQAGRDRRPEDAGVIVLQPDRPFDRAGAVRAAEYAALAGWLRAAHDGGRMICDPETNELRPLHWRDVAVLNRRASTFSELEQAFRLHGVPYRIEGGKVFYQREEIAAAVCGMSALENPDDTLALAQFLAGDLVGFTDEDLFLHSRRRRDRQLGYLGGAEEAGDELGELLPAMRELHRRRNRDGCLATVRGLFDLIGALSTARTFPRGEVAVANLHKVLAAAREADRARLTFGEFAREWAAALSEEREESDFAVTEDADDVVRVLTIHKAKGLAWPVVAIVDLAALFQAPGGPPPVLLRRRAGRCAVQVAKNAETVGYEEMRLAEERFEDAERLRQLYVAMTRARDVLVLPFFGKTATRQDGAHPPPGGYLGYLARAGMIDDALHIVDPCGAVVQTVAVETLTLADAPRWDLPGRVQKQPLDSETDRRVRELAERRLAGPPPFPEVAAPLCFASPSAHAGPLPLAEHRAPDGVRLGRAFHLVMERLNPTDAASWPTVVDEVAAAEDLAPGQAALLTRWLDNLGRLSAFTACRAGRLWRETPFTWSSPAGIAYRGKLDLLAETPHGLVILDYKTDRLTPEELAVRTAYYRPQGKIYCDAVAALTGRTDVRFFFCFVDAGVEVEIRENHSTGGS